MDGVLDFITDSLVPSSPLSSQRPHFTRIVGDTPVKDPPLTPLENKLKDIIVSIYNDTPSSPLLPLKEKRFNDIESTDGDSSSLIASTPPPPLTRPRLTIPKHLTSSLKNLSVDRAMSGDLLDPPIFSADDSPLSEPVKDIPFTPSPYPTGDRTNKDTPGDTFHGLVSKDAFFSANDVPQSGNRSSPLPSTNSPLSAAFSMPSRAPKFPGHPQRITDPPTTPPPVRRTSSLPSGEEHIEVPVGISDSKDQVAKSRPRIPEHVMVAGLTSSLPTNNGSSDQDESDGILPVVDDDIEKLVDETDITSKTTVASGDVFSIQPIALAKPLVKEGKDADDGSRKSLELTTLPSLLAPVKHPVKSTANSSSNTDGKPPHVNTGNPSKVIETCNTRVEDSLETGSYKPTKRVMPVLLPSLPQPLLLSSDINSSDLEKQVRQLMKQKANLEGQLQSVIGEYQDTLTDRALLSSKLSKAESELKTVRDELTKKQKPVTSGDGEDEEGNDLMVEIDRLESALRKKRQELAVLTKDRTGLNKRLETVRNELACSNENFDRKSAEVKNMAAANAQLRDELEEKSETVQTLNGRMANLQASLESTESSKTWLHDQLQEAIQSKLKMQDDLRSYRSTSISQAMKLDQLEQENVLLKQQMHQLQSSVLKDKANLVSELEAIEADVVSKESLYNDMESSQHHLEQILKLKNDQLEKLGDEVAGQRAKIEDLEHANTEDAGSIRLLSAQVEKLEDEKKRFNNALEKEKLANATNTQDLQDTKRAKNSLQLRLQQAEADLIGKEGTIQRLKDANEIVNQELEGANAGKDSVENELAATQQELVETASKLRSAELNVKRVSDDLFPLKAKLRNSEATLNSLKSELQRKEEESQGKDAKLALLEDQSSDIVHRFQSLKSQVDSVADQSGAEMSGKDKTIDRLTEELEENKLECDQLKDALNQVQTEHARLQGELESMIETSPKMDEIKRVLQEKNALEGQLGAERISHQQEGLKYQAKIARLQTDLNDTKRANKQRMKELEKEVDSLQEVIDTLKSELDHASRNMPEDIVDGEVTPLSSLLESREKDLELALEQQRILEREKAELEKELEKEFERNEEIRKADSVVALQMKQAAKERENGLNLEIQELVMDNERLKGRLTGTDTAQKCLREHVSALENSVAQKEGQLAQLMSQNASALSEKELELEDLKCKYETVQDSLGNVKAELEKILTEGLFDKQRAEDLESALANKEAELSRMKADYEANKGSGTIREQLQQELESQREAFQAEIRTIKQQLILSETSHDCTKKELDEKIMSLDILGQKLQLAQSQILQLQEELALLKTSAGNRYGDKTDPSLFVGGGSVMYSDDGMSVCSSVDDRILIDQNSLHKAQLLELQDRLVKARNEGQELGECKQTEEIKTLQSELGAKSKTLRTLKDCVSSLKDEMSTLQLQVNAHSSSLADSYKSSREIENKIEGLRRSQSGSNSPYPRVSTPTIH